jgi:hypothetical protein
MRWIVLKFIVRGMQDLYFESTMTVHGCQYMDDNVPDRRADNSFIEGQLGTCGGTCGGAKEYEE